MLIDFPNFKCRKRLSELVIEIHSNLKSLDSVVKIERLKECLLKYYELEHECDSIKAVVEPNNDE